MLIADMINYVSQNDKPRRPKAGVCLVSKPSKTKQMTLLSSERDGQNFSNEADSTPQNGNQMLLPEGLRPALKPRTVSFDHHMTATGINVKAAKSVVSGLPVERWFSLQ
jgi:hypothetical protein